ncbi:hypothetical protein [Campylobacter avium]|uniref:hypothetical protein n=1 Tax=Campylobacter avium TaxID=522485 RepID=UPI00235295A3|nr:hypothetical protein [Campylobacter avium]
MMKEILAYFLDRYYDKNKRLVNELLFVTLKDDKRYLKFIFVNIFLKNKFISYIKKLELKFYKNNKNNTPFSFKIPKHLVFLDKKRNK